jgi:hypothetical protein
MPGLNGPDLIRHVRSELPNLPILYIRNHDHAGPLPDGLPANVPTLAEPFRFLGAFVGTAHFEVRAETPTQNKAYRDDRPK